MNHQSNQRNESLAEVISLQLVEATDIHAIDMQKQCAGEGRRLFNDLRNVGNYLIIAVGY